MNLKTSNHVNIFCGWKEGLNFCPTVPRSKNISVDDPVDYVNTSKPQFMCLSKNCEYYDVIVFGGGLKECVISALLKSEGKKVLQLNKHSHMNGDDVATVKLSQLTHKLTKIEGEEFNFIDPFAPQWKDSEIWIDQAPKFSLASGRLTKLLLKEGLAGNAEFMKVHSAYIVKDGEVKKIPMNEHEAQRSDLLNGPQKLCFKLFLQFVDGYEEHNFFKNRGFNLRSMSTLALFRAFLLTKETCHFIGHALGLHTDDFYLQEPAFKTVMAIKTYVDSFFRFGSTPFLYHRRGYSDLVKKWYMHNTEVQREDDVELQKLYFDSRTGKILGLATKTQLFRAPKIVGNGTWFPSHKTFDTGKIIRSHCTLLENPSFMDPNADSCHLIVPGNEMGCRNDIHIAVFSSFQGLCPHGAHLLVLTKVVETESPSEELRPAFAYLPNIVQRYDEIRTMYEATDDGTRDFCFAFSDNYSESCTYEDDMEEVLSVYEKITGKGALDNFSVEEYLSGQKESSTEECKEEICENAVAC
mmetsp:Transcript_8177/g.10778  ORF Transcript_8177/g.10778 Transcript_8177/m.10778 type:complete len:524 (-) Transcript_8177:194-1765(-)